SGDDELSSAFADLSMLKRSRSETILDQRDFFLFAGDDNNNNNKIKSEEEDESEEDGYCYDYDLSSESDNNINFSDVSSEQTYLEISDEEAEVTTCDIICENNIEKIKETKIDDDLILIEEDEKKRLDKSKLYKTLKFIDNIQQQKITKDKLSMHTPVYVGMQVLALKVIIIMCKLKFFNFLKETDKP